ncbi:SGNH/GDSL hydrolase family protein [Hydrogenophaga sp. BPS33]|uniref:SGNH/GDSL hydrolase family protein n=1 Tax=Hydrogenophaga sp. BPS33 TaxID=2651974 RepID=UPI00132039B4|nr:SGNH/GDSL hydrolase family protein [Hydrogenophaga sp. BPS33]QHE88305.1 phospholipase [Hydrogenophaga sp. BPS33]
MHMRIGLAATAAVVILSACGGGGSSSTSSNPPSGPVTTAVKVVGDSLSDSGTFGIKFTVQGTPAYPIWTDRVASALAAPALCSRYGAAPGDTPALKPGAAACTSYGVGSAAINPRGSIKDTTPISVVQQLKDLRAQSPFGEQELLLVDGGGNDFADLAADYATGRILGNYANFDSLADELVPPDDKIGLPRDQVGDLYATRLANLLVDALVTEALNRGAQRIVVLTVPDITRTPKFKQAMAVAQILDAAGAADVELAAARWVSLFNTRLKARLAVHSRVVVVDFHAELGKWLSSPGAYGLTNTTKPACPGSIATCTDTSLSAAPPVGESGPDWWKTYVFSDNFHGTPRTNELMGDAVLRALEAKGWK